MATHLFQIDEESVYSIVDAIEEGIETTFLAPHHVRHEVNVDDEFILWKTGRDAFAFASYIVTGEPVETTQWRDHSNRDRGESLRSSFPVRFAGFLDREVGRDELRTANAFVGFAWTRANVTNPLPLTVEQAEVLFALASSGI